MEYGIGAAWRAWADLAGLDDAETQVVVDAASAICPDGWIGVLAIGHRIAAAVPSADWVQPVTEALAGLTVEQAVTPTIVRGRLSGMTATLGPAQLFYPVADFIFPKRRVDTATAAELAALVAEANPAEVEESGIQEIQSECFASRAASGQLAAACGYRRWPNGVAHLSILTNPELRHRGHGFDAAVSAINHAVGEELLPQWRARFAPSIGLARKLGLVHAGAQLSLKPE